MTRTVLALVTVMVILAAGASPAAASRVTAPPQGHFTITAQLVRIGPANPDGAYPVSGLAMPNNVGYDQNLWAVIWKCTYVDWDSRYGVRWQCVLRDWIHNANLRTNSGTFSGSSYSPGPWYYFGAAASYCVVAEAHYTAFPNESDTESNCLG